MVIPQLPTVNLNCVEINNGLKNGFLMYSHMHESCSDNLVQHGLDGGGDEGGGDDKGGNEGGGDDKGGNEVGGDDGGDEGGCDEGGGGDSGFDSNIGIELNRRHDSINCGALHVVAIVTWDPAKTITKTAMNIAGLIFH